MEFLSLQGGTVKQGMMKEAQAWINENEAELRSTAPEGTEYVGTYFPVFSSEKGVGDIFSVMRLDSYGALDGLAASSGSRFGELLNEWVSEFIDQSPEANGSSILFKAASDATIWGS